MFSIDANKTHTQNFHGQPPPLSVLSPIILAIPSVIAQATGFQSSGNLPIDWPTTTTTTMKGQVFLFRYERVNSKRKFAIVAEIVFLLKKIYKRDIPLKAMFNVKTLTVLFSPYPREMKTNTAKFKSAAILTLTYFYGNGVIHSHARQNRTRVAYTCALI